MGSLLNQVSAQEKKTRTAYLKTTILAPYNELAYRIVEQAVIDYVEWKTAKTPQQALKIDMRVDAIGAMLFLESQTARYYLDLPADIENVRAWVDAKILNSITSTNEEYEKLRKEHKAKNKRK